ncbi:hypothetical protein COU61_04910, partial [Candidatus Pacearchaeota archaeon CG10_big_fil_rev_8_21_14_0_10_35_13]
MRKLSEKSVNEIKLFIKKNRSLNEISRIMKMNKSTIYKYYREVKGKTMRRINMPKEESFIGEFIGLFAGDGNFYYDKKTGHYRIRFFFNIKEKKFVDELSRIFSENLS